MSPQFLQINFNFSGSLEALGESFAPAVQPIADTPGLHWKVWLMNKAGREAGGVYLFEDDTAVQAFLTGPIAASLKSHPALTNLSVKQFGILEEFTAATRGPIMKKHATFGEMAAAAFAAVPSIGPEEAYQKLKEHADILVIDARDAADVATTGTLPGALNISLGALTYKADQEQPEEWRDPRLKDHAQFIITTCAEGPLGAMAGKLLKDMGYRNVAILAGGVEGWRNAGYPTASGVEEKVQ